MNLNGQDAICKSNDSPQPGGIRFEPSVIDNPRPTAGRGWPPNRLDRRHFEFRPGRLLRSHDGDRDSCQGSCAHLINSILTASTPLRTTMKTQLKTEPVDKHAEYNKPRMFFLSVMALLPAGIGFSMRTSIADDLKTT